MSDRFPNETEYEYTERLREENERLKEYAEAEARDHLAHHAEVADLQSRLSELQESWEVINRAREAERAGRKQAEQENERLKKDEVMRVTYHWSTPEEHAEWHRAHGPDDLQSRLSEAEEDWKQEQDHRIQAEEENERLKSNLQNDVRVQDLEARLSELEQHFEWVQDSEVPVCPFEARLSAAEEDRDDCDREQVELAERLAAANRVWQAQEIALKRAGEVVEEMELRNGRLRKAVNWLRGANHDAHKLSNADAVETCPVWECQRARDILAEDVTSDRN